MRAELRGWVVAWWAGKAGAPGQALSAALWPAEQLFRIGVGVRNLAYDRGLLTATESAIPVVSVGNLTVGGVGKTPVAAWIAGELSKLDRRPAIILNGYGYDELLVHRELNPKIAVIEARKRADGVRLAASEGANVAVLDDAFQHRRIDRDLDVVLVGAEGWVDSPRLLPRGPWRETITSLRRADIVVVTRKSASLERAREVAMRVASAAPQAEIAICHLEPIGFRQLHSPSSSFPLTWALDRQLLAVASIGDTSSFVAQLQALGATVELLAFPDHHAFDVSDVRQIQTQAGARPIVMTRKDAVKLRHNLVPDGMAVQLEQAVRFESGGPVLLDHLRALRLA